MKKAIAALIILGVVTGCSTPAAEHGSPPSAAKHASPTEQPAFTTTAPEAAKQFQLNFTSSSIAKPLTKILRIEHSREVERRVIDESTVVIYEMNDDVKQFYAALQTIEGTYEIGQMGYEGANAYTIHTIEALGQTYIKVTGSVGANSPIADYVSVTTSPPILLHIEANTVEADVDQDGIKEIVATIGTAAETIIYKNENDSMVSANLNEIMNARVVLYDAKTNYFQAEVIQGQLSNWQSEGDRLKLIP